MAGGQMLPNMSVTLGHRRKRPAQNSMGSLSRTSMFCLQRQQQTEAPLEEFKTPDCNFNSR